MTDTFALGSVTKNGKSARGQVADAVARAATRGSKIPGAWVAAVGVAAGWWLVALRLE